MPFCMAQYSPADMLLGSQRFGPDLDVWSLGCVAAELFLREPLFQPSGIELNERSFLDAQFAILGTPPSSTNECMFTENEHGKDARRLPAKALPEWPPKTPARLPATVG